jgi:hypothetical protein
LSETIVEISGLRKVYGGANPVTAVDGIDLSVRAGRAVRSARPQWRGQDDHHQHLHHARSAHRRFGQDRGRRCGRVTRAARRCMGIVPQYNTLDRACTIYENIYFHCLYFGISRAEARQSTEPAAGAVPPERARGRLSRAALRRAGAAGADRPRHRAPAQGAVPRRAQRGPRPAEPHRHVGSRQRGCAKRASPSS